MEEQMELDFRDALMNADKITIVLVNDILEAAVICSQGGHLSSEKAASIRDRFIEKGISEEDAEMILDVIRGKG